MWDGQQIAFMLDTLGNVARYWTYDPQRGEPQSMAFTTSMHPDTNLYFVNDAQHNVVAMLKPSGGSYIVWNQSRYDPFGVSSIVAQKQAFRYKEAWQDAETAFYRMGARYYDPSIGRFLSEDPIGLKGGINQYAFAGNDPINGYDPSGQLCVTWHCLKGPLTYLATLALRYLYTEVLGPGSAFDGQDYEDYGGMYDVEAAVTGGGSSDGIASGLTAVGGVAGNICPPLGCIPIHAYSGFAHCVETVVQFSRSTLINGFQDFARATFDLTRDGIPHVVDIPDEGPTKIARYVGSVFLKDLIHRGYSQTYEGHVDLDCATNEGMFEFTRFVP